MEKRVYGEVLLSLHFSFDMKRMANEEEKSLGTKNMLDHQRIVPHPLVQNLMENNISKISKNPTW